MKSLEDQYGVPLFEQIGGKYELTRAGKALLHYATQIRSLGLEAGRVMAEQRSPERGIFHIGASYVAGTYLLPAWMHRFQERYPEVEVKLTIRTAPAITQLLAERRIDLGFIAAQQPEASELRCEPLCEDRMVVAFAADHPLAQTRDPRTQTADETTVATALNSAASLSPAEIAAFPFLLHGDQSTTRQMTDRWAEEHGIGLRQAMELDSLETIKRSLLLGRSVTFISHTAIREEVAAGRLACAPLPGGHAARMIYACYHPERWMSPQMSAFLEVARQHSEPIAT